MLGPSFANPYECERIIFIANKVFRTHQLVNLVALAQMFPAETNKWSGKREFTEDDFSYVDGQLIIKDFSSENYIRQVNRLGNPRDLRDICHYVRSQNDILQCIIQIINNDPQAQIPADKLPLITEIVYKGTLHLLYFLNELHARCTRNPESYIDNLLGRIDSEEYQILWAQTLDKKTHLIRIDDGRPKDTEHYIHPFTSLQERKVESHEPSLTQQTNMGQEKHAAEILFEYQHQRDLRPWYVRNFQGPSPSRSSQKKLLQMVFGNEKPNRSVRLAALCLIYQEIQNEINQVRWRRKRSRLQDSVALQFHRMEPHLATEIHRGNLSAVVYTLLCAHQAIQHYIENQPTVTQIYHDFYHWASGETNQDPHKENEEKKSQNSFTSFSIFSLGSCMDAESDHDEANHTQQHYSMTDAQQDIITSYHYGKRLLEFDRIARKLNPYFFSKTKRRFLETITPITTLINTALQIASHPEHAHQFIRDITAFSEKSIEQRRQSQSLMPDIKLKQKFLLIISCIFARDYFINEGITALTSFFTDTISMLGFHLTDDSHGIYLRRARNILKPIFQEHHLFGYSPGSAPESHRSQSITNTGTAYGTDDHNLYHITFEIEVSPMDKMILEELETLCREKFPNSQAEMKV